MISLLLGLTLLVAGGLGVILVDLLIKRPDVVAGLVLGSVIVEHVYRQRAVADASGTNPYLRHRGEAHEIEAVAAGRMNSASRCHQMAGTN
jgi:hypothetical protein